MVRYLDAKFADKELLFLNLDETSVPYSMQCPMGCVAAAPGSRLPAASVLKQNARGAMTYISIICDSKDIQGMLPHYLIATKTKLTNKVLRAQRALPQTRLQIIRQASARSCAANMRVVFQGIAEALKPFPTKLPILLLDCAPAHLPREVMMSARKFKLQLLYIPAQTTPLLQPLDLCGFSAFKSFLRQKHAELRSLSEDGLADPVAWLWQLMQCPREFFAAKAWQRSFECVGCSRPAQVQSLHKELQHLMKSPSHFPGSEKPTRAETLCIWPERRQIVYAYKALL